MRIQGRRGKSFQQSRHRRSTRVLGPIGTIVDHALHWGRKEVLDDPFESYFVYAVGFGTEAGVVVDSKRDVGMCDGH
jgi:hypothetical protein